MNNNNRIQHFEPDHPNFQYEYNRLAGTRIRFARAEDQANVNRISQAISNGSIDLSGTNDVNILRPFMRIIVEDTVNQVMTNNLARRPEHVAVDMNPRVATIATNIDSIQRPRVTKWTIGGIFNTNQYHNTMNEGLRIFGGTGLRAFHGIIEGLNNFATAGNQAARTAATMLIQQSAGDFRDELSNKLGTPPVLQTQIDTLQTQVNTQQLAINNHTQEMQNKEAVIAAKDQVIASRNRELVAKDAEIARLQQRIQDLQDRLENLQTGNGGNDDDDDDDNDDNNGGPGGKRIVSPNQVKVGKRPRRQR